MPKKIDKTTEEAILEMYKSHFSAKDISNQMNIPYPTVISRVRMYNILGVPKKNRFKLMDKDKLEQLFSLVNKNLEIGG